MNERKIRVHWQKMSSVWRIPSAKQGKKEMRMRKARRYRGTHFLVITGRKEY
jgi:hypothetical protein